MKRFNEKTVLLVFLFVFLFFIPKPAIAYIEPGSVSIILQVVASLMVGGAAVVAMTWGRIKAKLFRNKSR